MLECKQPLLGIIRKMFVIPGIYFGKEQERYLRLSIAGLSNEEIIEVKNRLYLLNEHLK